MAFNVSIRNVPETCGGWVGYFGSFGLLLLSQLFFVFGSQRVVNDGLSRGVMVCDGFRLEKHFRDRISIHICKGCDFDLGVSSSLQV